MTANMSTGIDIRQLEQSQHFALFVQGTIETYNNSEQKITKFAKTIGAVVLITPFSFFLFRGINKEQKKILTHVKNHALTGKTEYDKLLKIYQALNKFLQALDRGATFSAKDYDNAYKSAPLLLKPMLKPVFKHMKLNLELHKAIGEKLCLSPKNVTTQQLKEAALSKEDMEFFFDDEDDGDYIEYAKDLSMRQSGHR